MASVPREFFEQYVKRAVAEWSASPRDEYLAKTAVGNANIMAERMWNAFKDTAPHRVTARTIRATIETSWWTLRQNRHSVTPQRR